MDELLNRLLGYQLPQPNAPAYFEGDTSAIQRQAQQSGLLSAAMALLETGGPSQQRTNLGQAISRGVGSYQQGVSGSFDQALKDMLASQQMQDQRRKRTSEEKQSAALEQYISSLPADQQAIARAFPEKSAEAMLREQKASPGVVGEYNAAKREGLLPANMTLTQYIEAKRPPGTNIKNIVGGGRTGTIPPGFELREDKATGALSMAPIPGGPAEKELMDLADKAKGRKEQQARAGGTVVQDLQRALNIVQTNPTATGRTAAATALLPEVARAETDYQAAEGMVQSALSNVGLDTLQQMRENSPTGGALGQVPIQQQKRLEQVLGSLDLTQRKEVVEDNIKRVINIYMDIIHGSKNQIEDAFNRGEITEEQRKVFGFRHNLSFDELGNPAPKDQRRSLSNIFGGSR